MWLYAPRILYEPVRCRCSGFRTTARPARRLRLSDRSTGVGLITPATRRAASSRSAAVTRSGMAAHRTRPAAGAGGGPPIHWSADLARLFGVAARVEPQRIPRRADLLTQAVRHHPQLAPHRRRGPDPRPPRLRDGAPAAGQAQADLRAPHGHG